MIVTKETVSVMVSEGVLEPLLVDLFELDGIRAVGDDREFLKRLESLL